MMILSLALSNCNGSEELQPSTTPLGPSPTPILPAVHDLSEKMDASGILMEDCDLSSTDGRAILHLDKGTRVLNQEGQAISSITITTRPRKAEIEYSVLSSPTFEINPRGAKLDPVGQLTIHYDSPPDFTGIDPDDPQVGVSCGELEIDWEILDTQSEIDSLTAMADVDCLGSFIVIFLVRIIS